jgi:hypothetical protein
VPSRVRGVGVQGPLASPAATRVVPYGDVLCPTKVTQPTTPFIRVPLLPFLSSLQYSDSPMTEILRSKVFYAVRPARPLRALCLHGLPASPSLRALPARSSRHVLSTLSMGCVPTGRARSAHAPIPPVTVYTHAYTTHSNTS